MSRLKKIREKILLGNADSNIDFGDLRNLLVGLGFTPRIKGDHHIFVRIGVHEIINIQPKRGKAKPYQVKQVRNIILKYQLGVIDE